MAKSNAERQRAFRARRAAGEPTAPRGKGVGRRSRPKRWSDAVGELRDLVAEYEAWRDNLPPSLEESALAEKLDAIIALEGVIDELEAVELPLGYGRD
ncbi:MAG TPA: hypothetical protein VKS60_22010 [Stellaceae bacterium]|nr:hypothetical protein [Stellaceae bacterium]